MEEKKGSGKIVLIAVTCGVVLAYLAISDSKPIPSTDVQVTQTAPKAISESTPKPAVEVPKVIEKAAIEVPKVAEKPTQSFREAFNKSIADSQKEAVKNAHKVMIDSSLRQYEIVKRQGSATDVCIHANAIQGAYLGAEDEANYAKWRVIAQNDCKVAGVPSL